MITRTLRAAFVAVFALIFPFYSSPASAAEQLPHPEGIAALPKSPAELPESALIETTQGAIEIHFFRKEAPITVKNFVSLANKGFYNQLTFHRYVPDFILQGGDPTGTGKGGPGYTLPPETSDLRHQRGTVGMARTGNEVNPERRSNGSQFYICLNKARHLDGFYTIFAEVISGMEVVDKLRLGDQIIQIRFPKGSLT